MAIIYKDCTNFLVELGVEQVGHTEKTYLSHLISVHRDLRSWGCDDDVCYAGMFHSIYGTERFQKFTLSMDRRGEIRNLIGDRAERLAFVNCVMDRPTFDEAVQHGTAPFVINDRLTNKSIELSHQDFDDLCRIHLCDWLEQVPRCQVWETRREAYDATAKRLGGIAFETYEKVFAAEH